MAHAPFAAETLHHEQRNECTISNGHDAPRPAVNAHHPPRRIHLGFWSILYILIMVASVMGMVVGCLYLIDVLVPRFRIEEYKKRGITSDSVVHYASIAKHKTFTKFRNKLAHLSDEAMLEDLAEQIYICAIICDNKFTAYKKGLLTCVFSFMLFAFMAILGFIITK